MGQLIQFPTRRPVPIRSTDRPPAAPRLFFDLACPFSYLVLEPAERALGPLEWVPVPATALHRRRPRPEAARERAEELAAELGMPLVWPSPWRTVLPQALRVSVWAQEQGAGAAFGVAAARLAFCGGYDLADLGVLAEAAAAAGLHPREALWAAQDDERDEPLLLTAIALEDRGIRRLPALRLGDAWISGTAAVAAVLHLARGFRARAGGD